MKLNAVGVCSSNFGKTVAFYTLLGFKFPELKENEQHVESAMPGSARLMIDSKKIIKNIIGEEPHPANHSPFAIEYDTASQVNEVAHKVKEAGFKVAKEPWDAFWGQRYAIVEDPDGYKVDLYAGLAKKHVMKIAVGSKNPGKLQAVEMAFSAVWPDRQWEVVGVSVLSGVSDQPMSDKDSVQGARRRAIEARKLLDADYGVGLEGGLEKVEDRYFTSGWIVIVDRHTHEGVGSSIKLEVPPAMMKHIHAGKELGHVVDIVFGTKNAKHSSGHFGLMTNDAVTRINAYRDGVISALSRFIQPTVFEK